MDTIQARRMPTDGKVNVTVNEGDFRRDLSFYKVSKYRDRQDELMYQADTTGNWPVSAKIKNNTFVAL